MLKTVGITVMVATAVAVTAPRDLQEASTLVVRAGVALINLGVALYPSWYDAGYDAGQRPDDPPVDSEDAGLRAGAHLYQAQFAREWGAPYRPGCEMLGCHELWDDDLGRPFRRCRWRCPRPRPAPPVREYKPEPPSYRYELPAKDVPQYEAAPATPVPPEVIVIGLIALVVGLLAAVFSSSSATKDIDTIDADIAKTAQLAAKLEAASREADAHLAAFLKDGGRFEGDQDNG